MTNEITRARVEHELRRVADELDRWPNTTEFREATDINPSAAKNVIKGAETWTELLEAVLGAEYPVDVSSIGVIPERVVREELATVIRRQGVTPTPEEFGEESRISARTVYNQLGPLAESASGSPSWRDIMAAFLVDDDRVDESVVDLHDGRASTQADVIEACTAVADELGYPPRAYEFAHYADTAMATVYQYFSTWEDVLEAAGMDPTATPDEPNHEARARHQHDSGLHRLTCPRCYTETRSDAEEECTCLDCGYTFGVEQGVMAFVGQNIQSIQAVAEEGALFTDELPTDMSSGRQFLQRTRVHTGREQWDLVYLPGAHFSVARHFIERIGQEIAEGLEKGSNSRICSEFDDEIWQTIRLLYLMSEMEL